LERVGPSSRLAEPFVYPETPMQLRQLGRSELKVRPLCFGGNVFGWTADERTSFTLLDRFVDAGLNFIDTADVYSAWAPGNQGGESETIIGNWLKQRGGRDRVVLATKVGSEMGPGKKGLSKRYIIEAVEASLRRLQLDYIDLYQSHWDDPETPVEETLGAYGELIRQGKVRVIGCSNFTAARLTESLEASARLGLPVTRAFSPSTISTTGPASRATLSAPAVRAASASSPTSPSPVASSPASTAPRTTSARARAAKA
jgi:aryl-alcohol dehydrogenase-like predicted oxidoreductase